MLKRTPLFEAHRSFNAKLVDFTGYEMPLQYKSIRDEHLAVRNHAGIFDVSHMGEILIRGERAQEVVQDLSVNDASRLNAGKSQYSVMCRDNGGIVDDLLVYCLSAHEYMLVVNASNIEKDLSWILEVNDGRAEVSDISEEIALIAVQGPESAAIMEKLSGNKPAEIPMFEFRSMQVSDYDNILVSATGYTGEKGFELYCNIRHVNVCDLWDNIVLAGEPNGIMPCGLGARDTLRLEAGLALYGSDLTEDHTPLEAGLGWLIKWDKGNFKGKDALLEQKNKGVARRLCGFVMKEEKRIPRSGQVITDAGGEILGQVTSGCLSFMLNRGIAMGYIPTEHAEPGSTAMIRIRDRDFSSEVIRLPFYNRKK
jgi:aminomethyltransferase